ncbi:uncharacterized protein B0I36DRAFT_333863 [Microdochium trichocladiopsis]|uniref:Protamine P1 n=1 Tax=Microdochium trichocladiopsis TaxID=1682393 RepID=A0A9P8XY44_9PEZI|nr:uncharacterized protein B0I36DRAFT_333863 [Microdochium trichocladiopsis]KAH7021150.1 hypothetical protein B0I36DRAFT_333863 [Microdochium trichocladiopsis]
MSANKLDIWRLRELVDEPLYCAVPPMTNPDEPNSYDSDEELDSSARLAKRLRYEAAGRRFLSGQRPRLLSASLRGPFDAKSGWRNPWLSKSSCSRTQARNGVVSEAGSQTPRRMNTTIVHATAAVPITTEDISLLVAGSSSAVWSSAQATTPTTHIHEEKRIQIQVWADNVETSFVEDDQDFWNPFAKGQSQNEGHDQATDDAPTKNGWLKKTPLKRKRTRPQQPAVTSTVNRSVQLLRSTSDSAALQPRMRVANSACRHQVSSLLKSRSFELTTPSSLADPQPMEHDQDMLYESHSAYDEASTCDDTGRVLRMPDQETEARNHDMSNSASPKRPTASSRVALDEDSGLPLPLIPANKSTERMETAFESEANTRFHQHTMHSGQKKGRPDCEGLTGVQTLTQTETPESSHHPDELLTSANVDRSAGAQPGPADGGSVHEMLQQAPSVIEIDHHDSVVPTAHIFQAAIKYEPNSEAFAPGVAQHRVPNQEIESTQSQYPSAEARFESPEPKELGHNLEPSTNAATAAVVQETMIGQEGLQVELENEAAGEVSLKLNHANLQAIAITADKLSESVSSPGNPVMAQVHIENIEGAICDLDPKQISGANVLEIEETLLLNDNEAAQPRGTPSEPATRGSVHADEDASTHGDLSATETVFIGESNATPEKTFVCPSQQSPWAPCDQALLVTGQVAQTAVRPSSAEEIPGKAYLELAAPITPPPSNTTAHLGLKSFSRFNTPSPQRRSAQRVHRCYSAGQPRGILSTKSSQRVNRGARRRVSFAPLPSDVTDQQHSAQNVRAASPPPATTPGLGDEDVTDQFQGHFDSVMRKKARFVVHDRSRLDPISSGYASGSDHLETDNLALAGDEITTPAGMDGVSTEEVIEQPSTNEPQSPWRHDTQSDMVDDVAAVMGNLDAFLDAWSVEHEMQKAGDPVDQENHGLGQSRTRTSGNRFGLQELSVWN